jgi:hypothetical protein
MSEELLAEAHRFLDWARSQGAGLDGTDESVWFVQGVLASMAGDTQEAPSLRAIKTLAYSVYLAELLAGTCTDVRCVVEGEGMHLHDVAAVRADGVTEFTLNWVQKCLEDPDSDNVVFKYSCALGDFGEPDRAAILQQQLTEFRAAQ